MYELFSNTQNKCLEKKLSERPRPNSRLEAEFATRSMLYVPIALSISNRISRSG